MSGIPSNPNLDPTWNKASKIEEEGRAFQLARQWVATQAVDDIAYAIRRAYAYEKELVALRTEISAIRGRIANVNRVRQHYENQLEQQRKKHSLRTRRRQQRNEFEAAVGLALMARYKSGELTVFRGPGIKPGSITKKNPKGRLVKTLLQFSDPTLLDMIWKL